MKVLDLFSGIGGFSLGLERTGGFETVAFCEIDPYCQRVLKKHWLEVYCHDDVRTLEFVRAGDDPDDWILSGGDHEICRGAIDVVCGGFPCQDISVAGKQAGITGERSGLWSELARIIGEVQPRYAILENVTALLSGDRGRWFGRALGDLAEIGYDAEWHCIPASALGAHHHRDRVWVIAHAKGVGVERSRPNRKQEPLLQTIKRLLRRDYSGVRAEVWGAEPGVDRVADGVPRRMDRLKGLGNAVVPQIPELIGHAIISHAKSRQRRHPSD